MVDLEPMVELLIQNTPSALNGAAWLGGDLCPDNQYPRSAISNDTMDLLFPSLVNS
jgi:hypothetical protein